MTVRALAVSAGTLALVVAAGCGPETNVEKADEKPKQTEQEKTPSPTPSPSTPEISEEPYVQVALDYYEAVNKANTTGDADRLRELSTKACDTCRKTADNLERIHENGGYVKGGDAIPAPNIPIDVVRPPGGGTAIVTVVYKYSAQTLVEKQGAKPQKFPADLLKREFTLRKEGGEWLISSLVFSEYKK